MVTISTTSHNMLRRNTNKLVISCDVVFRACCVFLWPLAVLFIVTVQPARLATAKEKQLTPEQSAACKKLRLDEEEMVKLIAKPLYKFTEAEVDNYVAFLSAMEPELRKRIVHLCGRTLGNPTSCICSAKCPLSRMIRSRFIVWVRAIASSTQSIPMRWL